MASIFIRFSCEWSGFLRMEIYVSDEKSKNGLKKHGIYRDLHFHKYH